MSIESILQKRKQYNKENSKFIVLDINESLVGEFQDAEEYSDPKYGDRVALKFRVNGLDKVYNRPATGPTYKLLNDMVALGIGAGDTIKLTRRPNKEKSSVYEVEKVNKEEVAVLNDQKKNELAEIDRIFEK